MCTLHIIHSVSVHSVMPLMCIHSIVASRFHFTKSIFIALYPTNYIKTSYFYVGRDTDGDYVLRVGQDREVMLWITVKNAGEDAHEATVYIILPVTSMVFVGTDEGVCTAQFLSILFTCYHRSAIITRFS